MSLRATSALLAEQCHPKARESDLELIVGRLGSRDLLDQKAWPQQDAKGAGGAIARQEPLDLERDGRNCGQKRQLLEEEDEIVEESATRVDARKRGADRGKYGDRHHRHHDEERRSATRMHRRLRTCVRDRERLSSLVGADRLVLGPVVLKDAPNVRHLTDRQKIADDDAQLHDTRHGLECHALHRPAQAENAIGARRDGLRQRNDETDGDREREPRRRPAGGRARVRAGRRSLVLLLVCIVCIVCIVVGIVRAVGSRDHREER